MFSKKDSQIKIAHSKNKQLEKHLYYVRGMHCNSCEIIIEKKLLGFKNIKSVDAKTNKGEVLIEYIGKKPSPVLLNSLFKKENYEFSDQPFLSKKGLADGNFLKSLVIAVLIIIGFIYLNRSEISGLVNVNSKSSLPTFFALGLLAGISSCAALVGGIVLSMSRQWLQLYSDRKSTLDKLQPHLMFNLGRILSFIILGAILGLIGSKLQLSLRFSSYLVILVSIIMFFLGLQMLGVKSFNWLNFSLPKSATRYVADETKFKGRYMPLIMGALTFFLPCGFTITAQGLALLSSNPVQGALIMGFFALGTAPALLFIGLSTIKFASRPQLASQFMKVAGVLVLFFALFNINSQLNVLGFAGFNITKAKTSPQINSANNDNEEGLPEIVDGKQVLKMEASAYGYTPNYFKVRTGVPVKWEITDTGTSGCTNAIISKSLFDGEVNLTPGQTSVKEFTPTKPGKYRFSCWMGMVSGIIEVIDIKNSNQSNTVAAASSSNFENAAIISSGASSCGCGSSKSSSNDVQ